MVCMEHNHRSTLRGNRQREKCKATCCFDRYCMELLTTEVQSIYETEPQIYLVNCRAFPYFLAVSQPAHHAAMLGQKKSNMKSYLPIQVLPIAAVQ